MALTFRGSRVSELSLRLSHSRSGSLSASASSLLLFELSKSPFELNQILVSAMISGELYSSLSARWWLIHLIWWTFNTSFGPPGMPCADNAGGRGDFTNNLNAATPSC